MQNDLYIFYNQQKVRKNKADRSLMVIFRRAQINPNLFYFLPGANMTGPFLSPLFTFSPSQISQFYTNISEGEKDKEGLQMHDPPDDQIQEVQVRFARSKKLEKKLKIKSTRKKQEEYIPNNYSDKVKKKIVYEKDKERNILPNAISKLFFFLKSKTKSQFLLKAILEKNQALSRHLTATKFYMITSFIKSKMERYKTEKSIELLFKLSDPKFQIFTLQEQLSFIKVNAIMLRIYVKNHLYLDSLFSSKRISADKIKAYITKYRKILQISEQMMEKAKFDLDFSMVEANSTEL